MLINNRWRAELLAIIFGISSVSVAFAQSSTQCLPVGKIDPLERESARTVVVSAQHEPDLFKNPDFLKDFSLASTLDKINDSVIQAAGISGYPDKAKARRDLLQSLLTSFNKAPVTRKNKDFDTPNQVDVTLTGRPGEATLTADALLDPADADSMRIVGLFNRMDLKKEGDCGEHRLVYGKGNPISATNRLFLIFEARVKETAADTCLKIAEFWEGLSNDPATLATKLKQFYFDGLPGVTPVVHHEHLGLPLGQVRGNLFVNLQSPPGSTWQLREWRVSVDSGARQPVFAVDTVKINPQPELFREAAGSGDALGLLRLRFRNDFGKDYVKELTDLDIIKALVASSNKTGIDLINELGSNFHERYDDFESTSGDVDNPAENTATAVSGAATDRLVATGLAPTCKLSSQHIVNRAGALTCGGCHHFSQEKPIAEGIVWPKALGPSGFEFVHIDEKGNLSPALIDVFLPWRRLKLTEELTRLRNEQQVSASPSPFAFAQDLRQALSAPEAAQRDAAVRELTIKVDSLRIQEAGHSGHFRSFGRSH